MNSKEIKVTFSQNQKALSPLFSYTCILLKDFLSDFDKNTLDVVYCNRGENAFGTWLEHQEKT